jgi:hypothetical protein
MKNILEIIQKHSLTVRCLPYEVVSYTSYRDGDENVKYVDSNGDEIKAIREVVIQDYDLEYFQKQKPTKYCSDSAEKRYENWKKNFPNGKKILKTTKKVVNGGWWYVKATPHTGSTVQFSRKYDEFFAPTIEEAIKLYLDSLN